MRVCMLSTHDNPYDPIKQFDSWLSFDLDKGYNCCAFLARVARTSDQFTDEENAYEIEQAINEIIKYDVTNTYKKVTGTVDEQLTS